MAPILVQRAGPINTVVFSLTFVATKPSELLYFFIYVRDFHERKPTKKIFFKFYSVLILWVFKVTLSSNQILEICFENQLLDHFWEEALTST